MALLSTPVERMPRPAGASPAGPLARPLAGPRRVSRPARRRATATVLLVILVATGVFAVSDVSRMHIQRTQFVDNPEGAATLFRMLNQLRMSRGLQALVIDPRLLPVAQSWSQSMAAAGMIEHNPALASSAPRDWQRLGENVASGPGLAGIEGGLEVSPIHYAVMTDPLFQGGAVAVTLDPASGDFYVTEDFIRSPSIPTTGEVAAASEEVRVIGPPTGSAGYRLVTSDGAVATYGSATFQGSAVALGLAGSVVAMATTPSGAGYWLLGSDGGVFSFGDARFFGSTGGVRLNAPVVGMAATPSGAGYWLLASDGGVFTYGDARFFGSTGGMRLNAPAVAIIATRAGDGYWCVTRDGGVFAFGAAPFHGSAGGLPLNAPVVGAAATPAGRGYWMVASDGGIFSFGDAAFHGSASGIDPSAQVVGIAPASGGLGYWLATGGGHVESFGSATSCLCFLNTDSRKRAAAVAITAQPDQ